MKSIPVWPATRPEKELLPHHQGLLLASAITQNVANARGYYSETQKVGLTSLGFSARQVRVPALVIPLFGVDGEITGHQIRPDQPRTGERGRPVKYELPAKSRMRLDVNPTIRTFIGDPGTPLLVTEGVRKGDSAASLGLCSIALLGVGNWRGANELGGTTVLADWESVALKGRTVYIAFDSDVRSNRQVHRSLERLKGFLESRGANVLVIYLPSGENGKKVGLDDYLAAGHTRDNLLSLATDELQQGPGEVDQQPCVLYRSTPEGLFRIKYTDGGEQLEPLTNFCATIVEDVIEDDGADCRRHFTIEAARGHRQRRFEVPASQFDTLRWVTEHLGATAMVHAGSTRRDHARAAIQSLSDDVPERRVYCHTGWRKINERWVYLHAGGGIGSDQAVEVRLVASIDRYHLPEPPTGERLREAVRVSLGFLGIAPPKQTWPLLAAAYAAPLGQVLTTDFVVWMHGTTGERKSTVAALLLNHYGKFDRNNLPLNFLSTGNAAELICFHTKDAVVVADDYAPASDVKTGAEQDRVANRLLRGIGDSNGRQRSTADGRLRASKSPRCLVIATGELLPPGSQSSNARTLEVEWLKGSVDLEALTRAQERQDLYREALAGYLLRLSPQLDSLSEALPGEVHRLGIEIGSSHGRVAENAAKLLIGVQLFLQFATEVGAITTEEQERHYFEAKAALLACAARTGKHQEARRPVELFLGYLTTLLAQGECCLADRETGYAEHGAEKVGWMDKDAGLVYLLPVAVHRVVTKSARDAGDRFPATKAALGQQLQEAGLLAQCAPGRTQLQVRAEGHRHWCWVLTRESLFPDDNEDIGFHPARCEKEPQDREDRSSHHSPGDPGDHVESEDGRGLSDVTIPVTSPGERLVTATPVRQSTSVLKSTGSTDGVTDVITVTTPRTIEDWSESESSIFSLPDTDPEVRI